MKRAFESPVPDRRGAIAAGPVSRSPLGGEDSPDDTELEAAEDDLDAERASERDADERKDLDDLDDAADLDDEDLEDEDDLDDDDFDDLDEDDDDDDLVDLDDEYDDFDDEDRHPGPGRGDD